MAWPYLLSYFFGGAFLANAVPHLVAGIALGPGMLLLGLFMARQFGRFNGGNAPEHR